MNFQDVVNDLTAGRRSTGLSPFKQKMWPRFAYHFTDVVNAVSVLQSQKLFSREYALEHGLMKNDNASRDVISHTANNIEKYVRLYFRPRTPTQFYNEGFQVKRKQQALHANCPVPVFFIFKLPELLARPDVQFTDRSLALKQVVPRYHTPLEFSQLPFEDIYQEGPLIGLTSDQKKVITGRKQAEIIVPESLDLDDLKVILVRSVAEKETLLNLLHDKDVYAYDGLIKLISQQEDYFFMDRNFVESVELLDDRMRILSNVNEAYPSDWFSSPENEGYGFALNNDATQNYLNVTTKVILPDGSYYRWPNASLRALLLDKIELTLPESLDRYTLVINIDDHIAYKGIYERKLADADMPF